MTGSLRQAVASWHSNPISQAVEAAPAVAWATPCLYWLLVQDHACGHVSRYAEIKVFGAGAGHRNWS
ncbi:hypothetical protein SAMN04488564_113169 [Lentzea waywayandensis]|uniref:Uncharacterized protein n=1 Tax=Lentzea waywayandensis TaxID=84724 RepID=A0A1I6FEA6_9PSEU|nr:hypothetical protein SAMN04488564_113169 [Lentzea waywayandensis]